MKYDIPTLVSEATGMLKSLISIPSLSRDEAKAADYLQNYMEMQGMSTGRKGNNIWCLSPMFDLKKPTLLLSHRHREAGEWVEKRPVYPGIGNERQTLWFGQ